MKNIARIRRHPSAMAVLLHLQSEFTRTGWRVLRTDRAKLCAATGISHQDTVTDAMKFLAANDFLKYRVRTRASSDGKTLTRYYEISQRKTAPEPVIQHHFTQRKTVPEPFNQNGPSQGKTVPESGTVHSTVADGCSTVPPPAKDVPPRASPDLIEIAFGKPNPRFGSAVFLQKGTP